MQSRLNLVGIPFIVTYDEVTHLYMFDNSTTNGNLVIECNLMSTLGFDTALAFYNMSSPKATSCTLTSQKIVDLSGNNSFYFTTNLGLGNHSFRAICKVRTFSQKYSSLQSLQESNSIRILLLSKVDFMIPIYIPFT